VTVPRPTFGIDLGGTHLRVGVVAPDGSLLDEVRGRTPAELGAIVACISEATEALAARYAEAFAVGIGAAGMVADDGVIHYSPNIPAFVGAPLRDLVARAVAMPAALDNDANVAALGEATHGAARGLSDVLCITLGTGIGGGIISGGRLLRGAHGFGAEIGHFQVDPDGPVCACGERGHWEATASGEALGAEARARAAGGELPSVLALVDGDVDAIDGTLVSAAAARGAPDALALVTEYAGRVAIGLVGLVNIFDPELVVVSGGLVELGDVLLEPLRRAFAGHLEGARHRPPVPIVASSLGERAGVVGAAVLARGLAR
jgi:glucokinase